MKTRAKSARRKEAAGTRDRLLEVACAVFAERGYKQTRTQDICRIAGVNPAAVNYHFGGKEGIYRAVWDYALACSLEGAALEVPLSADADRDWLYRYVHACVLSVFDSGMPGVLRKLMTKEVADPSPISNDILANHIAPRYQDLDAHLRSTKPPGANCSAGKLLRPPKSNNSPVKSAPLWWAESGRCAGFLHVAALRRIVGVDVYVFVREIAGVNCIGELAGSEIDPHFESAFAHDLRQARVILF